MTSTIQKPRLVVYGAGQFGQYIIRYAVQKNWPLVAVYNRAGDKIGVDAGRLAGLDKDIGVFVEDCDTADYRDLQADAAVITTTDRLKTNLPAYERMMKAGLNVMCHGAESYYPRGSDLETAVIIDELAKQYGVSFTGSGIWDYCRIWPGILVAGPCTEINSLFHRSITDAQRTGLRMMMFTGVGMTVEEFDEKITKAEGDVGGFYKTILHQVLAVCRT